MIDRRSLPAIGAILAIAAFVSASNPPVSSDTSELVRNESDRYADELIRFLREVRVQYVREIGDIDLLEAAVQGLYEAARRPVPLNLREEFRRPGRAAYLAKLRADLGNH